MNEHELPDLRELAAVSAALERQPATSAIEWATQRFGDGLVLASSFQDCVLIDLAAQVAPDLEVVFLDTQYHFAETRWYVETVRRRYDLQLRIVEPDIAPDDRWMDDPDACCAARKVVPMAKALAGREAWMTGLRRDEAPTRTSTPIVGYDVGRGMVKVNPIATWTEADVERYAESRGLPEHPLREKGYASIGCWPCTRPVAEGEDPRAGRWSGLDKLECGLHT
ncbi:MAG TPA: phosphoadenylyl-sulfate reductase [Acidimicrobiia bacterium]|jgi:phosphoadenosine phosphosulfate reductase|nr:phosphoadenylyl-sulfate reductase [Acidimicrobiia bacterium]